MYNALVLDYVNVLLVPLVTVTGGAPSVITPKANYRYFL